MASDGNAADRTIYLREEGGGWHVGTHDWAGLPVASFAAALHVADAWLTVTADGEAVVVYADGQVTRHAAERDEGSNGGEARPSPRPGSD